MRKMKWMKQIITMLLAIFFVVNSFGASVKAEGAYAYVCSSISTSNYVDGKWSKRDEYKVTDFYKNGMVKKFDEIVYDSVDSLGNSTEASKTVVKLDKKAQPLSEIVYVGGKEVEKRVYSYNGSIMTSMKKYKEGKLYSTTKYKSTKNGEVATETFTDKNIKPIIETTKYNKKTGKCTVTNSTGSTRVYQIRAVEKEIITDSEGKKEIITKRDKNFNITSVKEKYTDKKTGKTTTTTFKYKNTFDKNGNIKESKIYVNGKLYQKKNYKYKKVSV